MDDRVLFGLLRLSFGGEWQLVVGFHRKVGWLLSCKRIVKRCKRQLYMSIHLHFIVFWMFLTRICLFSGKHDIKEQRVVSCVISLQQGGSLVSF